MPVEPAQLKRGAIAFAVFPFAPAFPLTLVSSDGQDRVVKTVEEYAQRFKGKPAQVCAEGKLRPVLLLHDGTRGENKDLVCLRISTVKDRYRKKSSWQRIEGGSHPFFFHLPVTKKQYQLPLESIIDLTTVATIHSSSVLAIRGSLSRQEMQAMNKRLIKALSLDLSAEIGLQAKKLLLQAGLRVS